MIQIGSKWTNGITTLTVKHFEPAKATVSMGSNRVYYEDTYQCVSDNGFSRFYSEDTIRANWVEVTE